MIQLKVRIGEYCEKTKTSIVLSEPVVKGAKEIVDTWEKEFPDYEIETIGADLELDLPNSVKGTLKVSMKRKRSESQP